MQSRDEMGHLHTDNSLSTFFFKFIRQTKSSILFCSKYPSVMSRLTDTNQAAKSHKRGNCWGTWPLAVCASFFPSLKRNAHRTLPSDFQKEVTHVFLEMHGRNK